MRSMLGSGEANTPSCDTAIHGTGAQTWAAASREQHAGDGRAGDARATSPIEIDQRLRAFIEADRMEAG